MKRVRGIEIVRPDSRDRQKSVESKSGNTRLFNNNDLFECVLKYSFHDS